MSTLADQVDIGIGVDTHRDTHSAAIVAPTGTEMQAITVAATKKGYAQLLKTVEAWPQARRVWAIEGTASYGAGLCRALQAAGERVIEIDHPARPARRNGSKTDALDAVRAACEALSRPMLDEPREGDDREALRVLNTTRESAVHARTQAINAVHALVVAAPDSIRDRLRDLTTLELLRRCAALRVRSEWTIDVQATVIALRSSARRAIALETEADELERAIAPIIARVAPALIARRGVGSITGAVILCAWSHAGRCRSEAAFAALGGISPIPASPGQTVRHRLNRCGDRQLNRAIHTVVITRSRVDPATRKYIERRTAQGRTPAEIRRCLKRYVVREIFRLLEHADTPNIAPQAA